MYPAPPPNKEYPQILVITREITSHILPDKYEFKPNDDTKNEFTCKIQLEMLVNCETDSMIALQELPLDEQYRDQLKYSLNNSRDQFVKMLDNYPVSKKISTIITYISILLRPAQQEISTAPEMQTVDNLFRIEFIAFLLVLLQKHGVKHAHARLIRNS